LLRTVDLHHEVNIEIAHILKHLEPANKEGIRNSNNFQVRLKDFAGLVAGNQSEHSKKDTVIILLGCLPCEFSRLHEQRQQYLHHGR
jgi:hypothetical protein